MRNATDSETAEIAHLLADDNDLQAHISETINEDIMETVYAVGVNEEVATEGIELSPEQEGALVRVAVEGMFDALSEFDPDDIQ